MSDDKISGTIVVFSDAHYSRSWDVIDRCLKANPDLHNQYLNPNRELERFIERVNQTPQVDAVINNGDAVDYHFSDFVGFSDMIRNRLTTQRLSNLDLFNTAIARLNKRYLAVPGNHDYRKEAYNYAIWGMEHVNISKKIRRKYRRRIGHHGFRGLWEFASIRVNPKRFDPLVNGVSIQKRQDRLIGSRHCVFLDTGSDAFVRARNLIKYCKQILTTRTISYDSDGLTPIDLNWLSDVLSRAIPSDILIFMHAPLINPRTSVVGKQYRLSIDRFDRCRARQKIGFGVILNGGAGLLNLLRKSIKNVALVTSHVHNSKYFLIDKQTLTAKEVSVQTFNKHRNDAGFIKHLTTLPLGAISPEDGGNKTGFLTISSNGFEAHVLRRFSSFKDFRYAK